MENIRSAVTHTSLVSEQNPTVGICTDAGYAILVSEFEAVVLAFCPP